MQISVIILNYNVRYFLEQCILSVQVALQGIDSEIIVVDNNSSDDSCRMVKELFPEVILIENSSNTGFPKGNNIGVEQAKGKYLCILNPDTVVSEDTFQKLYEFSESKSNLGIVGCQLIDGTGEFLPESKRNIPTPKVSLLKLLGNSDSYYANHLTKNQTGKADIFVGAFMFIEKHKYLEFGGFDEDFFMYGEDIDLSYRFLKSGYDNYYFSDTTIIHYKGESTNKDKVYLKRFYGAMSIFYKKHFKTNFLFDFITYLGIKSLTLYNQIRSKTIKSINYSGVYFISENSDLNYKITQILKTNVIQLKSISEINNFNVKNCLIIYDGNSSLNKDIIQSMKELSSNNNYFKILPKNKNFLIGSNSKNDKGGVVIIE